MENKAFNLAMHYNFPDLSVAIFS